MADLSSAVKAELGRLREENARLRSLLKMTPDQAAPAFPGQDVPIYLHPGPPPEPVADVYYTGFPEPVNWVLATSGYGWHYETSLHAVRMIIGGVFDRLPELKIIIGHLAEGIPFHLGRIDDTRGGVARQLAKPVSAYFRDHFWVTTSG